MNWKHVKIFVLMLTLLAFVVPPLMRTLNAQSSNGIHGAVDGDLYIPSPFHLWFGSGASTDAAISQQFGNTVTINGHIGGGAANDDKAGVCTLGTNCAITFNIPYVHAPVCQATDQTAIAAVKAVATTTVLTITGTGTDTISYFCFGNPN